MSEFQKQIDEAIARTSEKDRAALALDLTTLLDAAIVKLGLQDVNSVRMLIAGMVTGAKAILDE